MAAHAKQRILKTVLFRSVGTPTGPPSSLRGAFFVRRGGGAVQPDPALRAKVGRVFQSGRPLEARFGRDVSTKHEMGACLFW